MKQIKNHPYIDRRTVKAWISKNNTYIQICDNRDIYYGFYNVEAEIYAGGLNSIFESRCLPKCEQWVQENADKY